MYIKKEVVIMCNEYTQGVCQDGAAILCNGEQLTIEEILEALNEAEEIKSNTAELIESEKQNIQAEAYAVFLKIIYDTGGTGATHGWEKGWDEAINEIERGFKKCADKSVLSLAEKLIGLNS